MRRLNIPEDPLLLDGAPMGDSRLLDFLVWAYSDLCDDVIKGIFAEWLVAKLLGIRSQRRYEWANSDLVSTLGTTIEVKSTSYWQSWKALDPTGKVKDLSKFPPKPDSQIRFAGLMAKDTIDHHKDLVPQFKSQAYVFCFQKEKDYENWNAMDLSQWEFYLATAKILPGKSVTLKWLKERGLGPYRADELSIRFGELEGALGVA